MGQQWKVLPALTLFQKLNSPCLLHRLSEGPATHPSETEGKVQGRGRGTPPTHTAAALSACRDKGEASRRVPATQNACVSTCAFVIDVEWQGQGIPLTIIQLLGDVSCHQHHPETSTTLVPRKISEVGCSTPVKGRTKLFYFNVFVQQRLWHKAKTYWRASDSEALLWQLLFF